MLAPLLLQKLLPARLPACPPLIRTPSLPLAIVPSSVLVLIIVPASNDAFRNSLHWSLFVVVAVMEPSTGEAVLWWCRLAKWQHRAAALHASMHAVATCASALPLMCTPCLLPMHLCRGCHFQGTAAPGWYRAGGVAGRGHPV